MSWLNILSIITIGLGLLICTILISRRENRNANIFLIIVMLSVTYVVWVSWLIQTENIFRFPHLYRTASIAAFILAPSAYFYICSKTGSPPSEKILLVHSLPLLFYIGLLLPFLLLPASEKILQIKLEIADSREFFEFNQVSLITYFFSPLIMMYSLIYAGASLNRVRAVHQKMKAGWLYLLIAYISCAYFSVLLGYLMHSVNAHIVFTSLLCAFSLATMWYMFFYPSILYGKMELPKREKKTSIPFQQKKEKIWLEALQLYMQHEKPYLSPDLNLDQISAQLDIPRHYLSILFRKAYNMHFNDTVNFHRIEYLRNNIDNEEFEKYTIEAIATSVGFRSRSTFLNAVKKFTDKTPSEFLANLHSKQSNAV